MTTLATPPKLQFFDANGNPLAGGKLYTYAAGTTTPLATYTDYGGGTANSNPVILDSRGEANVWLGTALYKFKLTTSTNVDVWTVDNVAGAATLAALAASGGSALVGYTPAGTGAVATTVQAKLRESVSVLDFGANPNGVADCQPAVQAAVNYAFANNISSVYFPNGIYFYATPVIVNFDAQNGLRLYGEAMANYLFFDVGGTRFIGTAGMESIFILTKTNLAVAGGYSFECSHIYFKSGVNGTTGPLTAIKNKVGGAPARPFIVKNCGFLDFDKAIVSDLTGTGGLQTGICQVIIRENTFCSCAYAIYGTGAVADGTMMDFIFCDNVSENGGSIFINGLAGTFNISDNILEGQLNAIQLIAGLANGQIRRNYFEANSGYLYRFSASNFNSSIEVGDNYIVASAAALVTVIGANYRCDDNYEKVGVIAGMLYTDAKSRIVNAGVLRASEAVLVAGGTVFLDYNCVSRNTSVYPGTLTSGSYVSTGGAPEVTPIGTVNVETVAGLGGYVAAPVTLNANDWVVAMCLVRTRVQGAIIYATFTDNAGSTIGNSDTSQTVRNAALGEWVFMLVYVKVSASSAGNVKFRWVTSGGSVDVTTTYVYKVAAPSGSSPLYYCLPNQ